jgi:hypothetical protein
MFESMQRNANMREVFAYCVRNRQYGTTVGAGQQKKDEATAIKALVEDATFWEKTKGCAKAIELVHSFMRVADKACPGLIGTAYSQWQGMKEAVLQAAEEALSPDIVEEVKQAIASREKFCIKEALKAAHGLHPRVMRKHRLEDLSSEIKDAVHAHFTQYYEHRCTLPEEAAHKTTEAYTVWQQMLEKQHRFQATH